MNVLHEELRSTFAAEVGEALVRVNVAAHEWARHKRPAKRVQRMKAWINLAREACRLAELIRGWEPFGFTLNDVAAREACPRSRPLWDAAVALYQGGADVTEEEAERLTDRLKAAALAAC